jgi:hypothetical protein
MGTGSSAFNCNDINIDFPEDILREFSNIKNKYFVKEDGSFYIDIVTLNCKAMPDALNYIHYYDYPFERRNRIHNIVYDIITNKQTEIK